MIFPDRMVFLFLNSGGRGWAIKEIMRLAWRDDHAAALHACHEVIYLKESDVKM